MLALFLQLCSLLGCSLTCQRKPGHICTFFRILKRSPHCIGNDTLYASLTSYAEQTGIKSGAVLFVARAAVSGLSVTPGGATEIMEILGKDETLARLQIAAERLG